jgi:hypothetical protein
MPPPRWFQTARDITHSRSEWENYIDLAELMKRTSLSDKTINDSLLRPAIDDPENPRGAICRPAARIGHVPMWLPEQEAEYQRRKAARTGAHRSDARLDLPMLTDSEASQRGLADLATIAAQIPPHATRPRMDPVTGKPMWGRAENTLRRYERDYRSTFPPEVAIAERQSFGPPKGYRSVAAVLAWVLAHEAGNAWPVAEPEPMAAAG